MRALQGVTVVALEQAVAAPLATRQLADLGARVIKIERPGGGDFARGYDATVRGMSSHFVWLNRNKESIALDLAEAAGRETLAKLIARADVFIQNLGPGAADRLGCAPDTLLARHPRLIVCGVSGYGTTGPYRDKRAYDLLVQCETGIPSVTGTPEQQAKAGIPVADIAGGMSAFSAILAALYQREHTGEGRYLEVSLFESLADWVGFPLYYTMYGGAQPPRAGLAHPAIAPYGPYRTGDGETVFVAVQNEREWVRLCADVLGTPSMATDPRFATNDLRSTHRDDLRALIEERFADRTATEVSDELDKAKIANATLRDIAGFAAHPQLAARNRWHDIDSPVGPITMLIPPVSSPGWPVRTDSIPEVGQHTDAILAELALE
jgi:crotonobetainyl-CoA:carnitine CoA-transferase CaiB-like acyl-CoA transferase